MKRVLIMIGAVVAGNAIYDILDSIIDEAVHRIRFRKEASAVGKTRPSGEAKEPIGFKQESTIC